MKKRFFIFLLVMFCAGSIIAQKQETVSATDLDAVLKNYFDALNNYCSFDKSEDSHTSELEKDKTKTLFYKFSTAVHTDIPTVLYPDIRNTTSWIAQEPLDASAGDANEVHNSYLNEVVSKSVNSFSYKLYNSSSRIPIVYVDGVYIAKMPIWVTIKKNNGSIQGAENITFVLDEPGIWRLVKTEYSDMPAPPTDWGKFVNHLKQFGDDLADLTEETSGVYWGLEWLFNPLTSKSLAPELPNWGLDVYLDGVTLSCPAFVFGLGVGLHLSPAYEFYSSSDAVSDFSEHTLDNLVLVSIGSDWNPMAISLYLTARLGLGVGPVQFICGLGPMVSWIETYSPYSKTDAYWTFVLQPMVRVAFPDSNLALSFSCLLTPSRYQTFQNFGIGIAILF